MNWRIWMIFFVGLGMQFGWSQPGLPQFVEEDALSPSQVLDAMLGEWHQSYANKKAVWTERESRGTASFSCQRTLGGRYVEQLTIDGTGAESKHVFLADDKAGVLWRWHFPAKGAPTASKGEWDGESETLTWTVMGAADYTATTIVNYGVPGVVSWVLEIVGEDGETLFLSEGKDTRLEE